MKSAIEILPSAVLLGFAYLLSAQAPPPAADLHANCQREIQQIRQEQKRLSGRLNELTAQTHHVLPRGGLV